MSRPLPSHARRRCRPEFVLMKQLRRRVRLHRLRRAVQVLQDRRGLQVSLSGRQASGQLCLTDLRYPGANSRCGDSCKCAETGGACKCAPAKKSRNYCKGCTVM